MHLSALAASSLLAGVAYAYGAPGTCSGACNIHDPALIRRESDGKYFRFSTGNRISYASAPAIGGPWTVLGSILPDGSSINLPGNDDLWVCMICSYDLRLILQIIPPSFTTLSLQSIATPVYLTQYADQE
jgi:hypothetical protein